MLAAVRNTRRDKAINARVNRAASPSDRGRGVPRNAGPSTRFEGSRAGKSIVMTDKRAFLESYSAVLVGLVLFLAGSAGLGVFLTLAAEGMSGGAVTVAILGALGLALGIGLLVVVFRRRGGLLRSRTSPAQRRRYRAEYRKSPGSRDDMTRR